MKETDVKNHDLSSTDLNILIRLYNIFFNIGQKEFIPGPLK